MPNKNYVAGRNFEYARKKVWESKGYVVIRASGSHGPYDLIAIKVREPVALIQCKRVRHEKDAYKIIRKFIKNPPLSTFGHYIQVIEVHVVGGKVISDQV